VMSAVSLALRTYYLARIFEGYAFVRHAARAMLPTVPAVAVVIGLRLAESSDRTLGLAIAEVVAYGIVAGIATVLIERRLLGEVVGYLRNRSAGPAPASV